MVRKLIINPVTSKLDYIDEVILGYAKGNWDASTNTPTISDATGVQGDWYYVSVGGTQNLGSGNITFGIGDIAMHNGSVFQKIDTQMLAGGNNTEIQFNSGGLLSGDTTLTFNNSTKTVSVQNISTLTLIATGNISALNLTGTNTGDETTATIKSKLGVASGSLDGYLTSADWTTFNSKQSALGFTPENTTNKVTSISGSSTDTQYPSAKLVYDQLQLKANVLTIVNKVFADSGYTATGSDFTIVWTTTSGNCICNLPSASGISGRIYNIAHDEDSVGTNTLTVNSASGIGSTATTSVLIPKGSTLPVQSNGTKWIKL